MSRLMRADQTSGDPDALSSSEFLVLSGLAGSVGAGASLRDVVVTMGQVMVMLGARRVPHMDATGLSLADENGEPRMVLGARHGFGHATIARAMRSLRHKGWLDVECRHLPDSFAEAGPGRVVNCWRFTVPERLQAAWERIKGQSHRARGRSRGKGKPTPKAPQNQSRSSPTAARLVPSNDVSWQAVRDAHPCPTCEGAGGLDEQATGRFVACPECRGRGAAMSPAGP